MDPILRIDAGRIPYSAAYRWQQELHRCRVANSIPDVLLMVEHPHVFTLGRRFRPDHLLVEREEVRRQGIEIHEADRGGSITYHGPGQLVAYPVIDLRTGPEAPPDVIRYLRKLEEATLAAVVELGVPARIRRGLTGIWVDGDKIASIGVNVSRGVTKHGVAVNISTDLSFFSLMLPCGIPGAGVTSMEKVLGRRVAQPEVAGALAHHLAVSLGRRLQDATPAELRPADPETGEASMNRIAAHV